jgi:ATP-binding cassette subfamily B protein/ATP-binding cassette subfamily C protein
MADHIIVLEKGKISERGSHAELIDNEGQYSVLFNLQAQGYR